MANRFMILLSVILALAASAWAEDVRPTIPTTPLNLPATRPGYGNQTFGYPDAPWLANVMSDSANAANPPDGAIFVASQGVVLTAYNYPSGTYICRYSRSTNSGASFTPQTVSSYYWVDDYLAGNGRDTTYFLGICQPSSGGYHLFVRRSTNAGATWSDTTRVDRGSSTFTDRPSLISGGNYVYATYTDFSGGTNYIRCCRSSNWGTTWNTGDVNVSTTSGQGSNLAVAPNGNVYVTWGQGTAMMFNLSTNHGANWGTPLRIYTATSSSHLNGWRSNEMWPVMAVASTGKIYCTFQSDMHGTGWDVAVMYSTNNGTTWSTPVRVNDDTVTNSDQHCPWITVDRYDRPHVFWYDSRNYYPTNSGDIYYSYSTDGGATWRPNERVNDVTPVFTSSNSGQMGDYQQIMCDTNYVYCEWSDHRNSRSWSYIPVARRPLPPYSGVEETTGSPWTQSRFYLQQSIPNPVLRGTEIAFQLENSARATLRVYDLSGKLVRTVVTGSLDAGSHTARWDTRDESGKPVASGVYFYRLESGGLTATKQLVVTR